MDKYYTPELSEFYVGFEYEILKEDNDLLYQWENNVAFEMWELEYATDILEHNSDNIRVKYLDKEDIENLGFKLISAGEEALDGNVYNKDIYQLGDDWLSDNVVIIYPFPLENHYHIKSNSGYVGGMAELIDTRFVGEIKNKSELVKLLKQLGS